MALFILFWGGNFAFPKMYNIGMEIGKDRNALAILSQKLTFCHLPCRFVHFSGIGPRFAIPLCGSDKELRK